MFSRINASRVVTIALLCGFAAAAVAESWNAEQQEIWKLEQQQWKLAAAKDLSWIDSMVHPNLSYWETGQPMPQNRDSLARWNRYQTSTGTTLEQEILPISIVVTGNVAVVNYYYSVARENYKKERETVTGHYMDVLTKDKDGWKFIAWAGGDDPKK